MRPTGGGRRIDDVRHGYLRKKLEAHVVIFRFGGDGRMYVVRVLHGRMNVEDHL